MGLSQRTTRTFHKYLYPDLRTVVVRKRGRGQQQSESVNHTLYGVRQKRFHYGGQNVDGAMTTNHYCEWMLPRTELDRVGIDDLNMIDTITDVATGEIWLIESRDVIEVKLWRNYINLVTKRIA